MSPAPPGPEEAQALRQALTSLDQALHQSTRSHVATMIARLANIYRAEKGLTRVEAEARLDTYQLLLEEIPPDILLVAFKTAGQRLKFFPTVAELWDIARPLLLDRQWMRARAAWLILQHETRWKPEPVITDEERLEVAAGMAELAKSLAKRFPSTRQKDA